MDQKRIVEYQNKYALVLLFSQSQQHAAQQTPALNTLIDKQFTYGCCIKYLRLSGKERHYFVYQLVGNHFDTK